LKSFEVLKEIKTCNNNCIFCFINQLPKGLRPSLYIKDDDYMLSYMYGNFVTLTNVSDDDLNKIIKYKLDPLNVSVHSMDSTVRSIIFGSKKSKIGVDNLKTLDRNGIETNIQIVLCPGINDGRDLSYTLFLLLSEFDHINSIGIVPVGITKFNTEKELKPCNSKHARNIIRYVNQFKIKNKTLKAEEKIFLSDEFYILAGARLPDYSYYGDFCQIKNGIGKSADFIRQIYDYIVNNDICHRVCQKEILVVTSEYGEYILRNAIKLISNNLNKKCCRKILRINLLVIKNDFFGGNVKVSGLLTGHDIISKLEKAGVNSYEEVIIPDSIFNDNDMTIEGYSRKDLKSVSSKIKIISEEGLSFIKELVS
jgi:putative radical SAM enzyme (TIGR03279 family)